MSQAGAGVALATSQQDVRPVGNRWVAWLASQPLWRIALLAWLGQRALVCALVMVWQALFGVFSPAAFVRMFTLYDGIWYTLIAQNGYHILQAGQPLVEPAAFFPLYPLLMRVFAPLFGGNVVVAGLVISNALSLAAFVALGWFVARAFNAQVARRTLLYYALFPTGLFFMSVYTEALFLLLSVGAFICMRQRRWLLSALLITLATLTRAQGTLLLLPLVIEGAGWLWPRWRALGWRERVRTMAPIACGIILPLLAFAALQVSLAALTGIPNAMARAAGSSEWRRSLDWPWAGVVIDLQTLARGGPSVPTGEIMKDFVFLALWLGLGLLMLLRLKPDLAPGVAARLRLPWSYIAYSWAALLQLLLVPAHIAGGGLMSLPRYMLTVFPCFILLAQVGLVWPRAHRLTVALSIAWVIILTQLLARAVFVA